jgi:hypothetical protein
MPFLASLSELSDEFFLFCINADHRFPCGKEPPSELVDVPELIVAVWVLASLHLLTSAL